MTEKGYNHRDEIEQALQASLEGYRSEADAYVWENIEAALHRKEKKRALIWWFSGAAAAASVAALGLVYFLSQSPAEQTLPTTGTGPANTEAPANPVPEVSETQEQPAITNKSETPDAPEIIKAAGTDQSSVSEPVAVSGSAPVIPPNAPLVEQYHALPAERQEEEAPVTAALEKMSLLPLSGPFASEAHTPEMEKRFFPIDPSEYAIPKGQSESWALAANLASSGSQSVQKSTGESYGFTYSSATNTQNLDERGLAPGSEATYHPPVIIGLRAGVDLSKRLNIESGITYSLLPSSIEGANLACTFTEQVEQHYLGMPFLLNYKFLIRKRFNVYSSQGLILDKAIAINRTTTTEQNGVVTKQRIHETDALGMQGALTLGIGLDYHISQVVSLYLQPSVSSWLLNGISNQRNLQLFWPNAQVGVRFRP